MAKEYCVYCMNPSEGEVCPHCGKKSSDYASAVHQLQAGTVLNGKYLIGAVLGEGGFGITYVGRDIMLDMKIAIKEYFPNGIVNRNNTFSSEITKNAGNAGSVFSKGKNSFLTEARTLAKFASERNCVSVRDFFEENNTAYIVMEYLEGTDLKDYLAQHGKLSFEEAYKLLSPVMKVLGRVHEQGLIHRDISPANIMVLANGQAKLLDFGAARDVSGEGEKSLSILLKPGYAPEEQYRTKGKQGPWTDIYALSATVYKLLTEVTPEDSMNRVFSDEVQSITALNPGVTPEQEAVVMKGMSVKMEDRYQNMNEMILAYEGALPTVKKAEAPAPAPEKPKKPASDKPENKAAGNKKKLIISLSAAAAVAVIAVAAGVFALKGKDSRPSESSKDSSDSSSVSDSVSSDEDSVSDKGSSSSSKSDNKPDSSDKNDDYTRFTTIEWQDTRSITASDIAELANYTNMTTLKLVNCGLTDELLKEVAKLTKIEDLDIDGNEDLTDLSCLKEMGNLYSLSINECTNIDVSKMPDIPGLEWLECSGCNITDIAFVGKYPELENLYIGSNQISDISPLAGCPSIFDLDLSFNQIEDISVFADTEGPYTLNLSNNKIADISPLDDHSEIRYLYLSHNQIKDIAPLKDCFKIGTLDLSYNQIEDIGAVSTIDDLRLIYLRNNNISSIKPLSECANLVEGCTNLDISHNALTSLEGIEDFKKLSNLNASHNKLKDIKAVKSLDQLGEFNFNNNQLSNEELGNINITASDWGYVRIIDNPITSVDALVEKLTADQKPKIYLSYNESINWENDALKNCTVIIYDVDSDRSVDALKKLGYNSFNTTEEYYENND